jgi:hypothetical protein
MILRIFLVAALSLLVHLVLGWGWTIVAGIVAGFWIDRRGWLVGAAGVGLGWLILVGHAAAVAGPEVGEMARVMGEVFGGFPGAVIYLLSVVLGLVLGLIGGVIGSQSRALVRAS